jgi:hypothetical protein
MLNSDNGLMVRTVAVAGSAEDVGAALRAADRGPAPPAQQEMLRRGGLRLARLRAADVGPLLDRLGAAPLDVAAWHGQVLEWREVAAAPVAEDLVLELPAGPRRPGPGKLRLLARSWTVATERGPALYLELRAAFARDAPRLARLLGDDAGEPIEGITIEILLEAGEACVLTAEAPGPAGSAAAPPTAGEHLLGGPPRVLVIFVPSIPARLFEPYAAR